MDRPEFWGLYPWLSKTFYPLALVSILIFSWGFYNKLRAWAGGRDEEGELKSSSAAGLAVLSVTSLFTSGCLLAGRSMRISKARAVFLLLIKWSFLVLFAGTVISFLNFHVFEEFLKGAVYHSYKLALDWAGLLFVLGVLYAVLRRLFVRGLPSTGYDFFLLAVLFMLGITPFMVQGVRFNMAPWPDESWSPLGLVFKRVFSGLPAERYTMLYNVLWALHALLALFFIAYIPYSRIFHVFAAQITTQAARRREREADIV